MNLSGEQLQFLENEFGLTGDDVAELGYDEIKVLREKCFDIEVKEATVAIRGGKDIIDRGRIAADIVDAIMKHIKSVKQIVA